jgi:hypothetical protein
MSRRGRSALEWASGIDPFLNGGLLPTDNSRAQSEVRRWTLLGRDHTTQCSVVEPEPPAYLGAANQDIDQGGGLHERQLRSKFLGLNTRRFRLRCLSLTTVLGLDPF